MGASRWWSSGLLLFPVLLQAQVDSTGPELGTRQRLMVEAMGLYDSNAIYNDLVTGLYRGGFLSPEIRTRNAEAMTDRNRAGFEWGATITYAWGETFLGRNSGWRPRISLSHQAVLGLVFSGDVFRTAFFGNKPFEEKVAHWGPGQFGRMTYQRISFGAEDQRTGSFVELGLVNGARMDQGVVRKADLYTAAMGQYVEVELDGKYQRSDTAAGLWSRGLGAAITGRWRKQMEIAGHRTRLSASVTDLGFVAWNARTLAVDKDTVIHYDGFQVEGILDLDDLMIDQHGLQDSLGLGYRAGSRTTVLPARLEARLEFGKVRETGVDLRYAYTLSVDHRLLPGYTPKIAIWRDVVVSDALAACIGVQYGGFGGVRVQAGMELAPAKHWLLGLHTENILGFLPGKTRGKALGIQLAVAW